MRRIIPSEVVKAIGQLFPHVHAGADFELSQDHRANVLALLDLIELIPPELMPLDIHDTVQLVIGRNLLREALTQWETRDVHFNRVAGGHRTVIYDIRDILIRCPKAVPTPATGLSLLEAFDYLDVCWRLAFGKKQALVQCKNLTGVGMLSHPCATRDKLIARLSALVDILNLLAIPDKLLPEPSNVKPGTLNRLQTCLKGCLNEAEYLACEHAITLLRAVIDLRNFFQHSATSP